MHSKIRRKRFGYPTFPTVGHKTARSTSGLIEGKKPIVIENMSQLYTVTSKNIVVLSRRLGAKKRVEMLKKVQEMKLPIVKNRGEE